MSNAELKLKIFRELDALDEKSLEQAYKMLLQFFEKENTFDWNKLSRKQQEGIQQGIKQLDAGKGIAHRKVMSGLRKKYNA